MAIILTTMEQKCGGGECERAATLCPSSSTVRSPRMRDWQTWTTIFRWGRWAMYGYLESVVYTPFSRLAAAPQSVRRWTGKYSVLQTKHLFTIIIYLSIHLHTLHMSSNHTDIKWYCSYKKAPNFILNDARVPLFICLGNCCVWDMNIKSTFLFFTSSSWYQMTVAGNWLVIQAH